MYICPKCGHQNVDVAKFCRSCGTPLTPAAPRTLHDDLSDAAPPSPAPQLSAAQEAGADFRPKSAPQPSTYRQSASQWSAAQSQRPAGTAVQPPRSAAPQRSAAAQKRAYAPKPEPTPNKDKMNAIILSVVIILAIALVVATVAVFVLRGRGGDLEDPSGTLYHPDTSDPGTSDPDASDPDASGATQESETAGPDTPDLENLDRYYATGTEDGLSLRTEPGENGGQLLASLQNGTELGLIRTDDTAFWYVYCYDQELYGYVRRDYLTSSTSAVTAPSEYYVTREAAPLDLFLDAEHSKIGRSLSAGDTVTVLSKPAGAYWYVSAQEAYGYVLSAGLSTERPAEELRFGPGDPPADNLGTYYVVDVAIYLALRDEQAYDPNNELGKMHNGETVKVISQGGQYWYVYSDMLGMYGYANGEYLSPDPPAASNSSDLENTYYVTDVTYYLALRTACTYDASNEIGEIHNGEPVVFISTATNGYWYVYAPTLDQYGYVNSKYLTK